MTEIPDDFRVAPDRRAIRDRRVRHARRAIDCAVVLAGIGLSFALLAHPSLAKAATWLAVFIAVTAFAVLQREMSR